MKIGLETHVQLNTESKLLCSCRNDPGAEPNTNVCPVCLGHPGSRPRINEAALEKAEKLAEALDAEISDEFFFSRKTYFYPDMSKNFQTTQYERPVATDGKLEINKEIGIRRLHLEEDPARLKHGDGHTKVDYNRAGTPLIEIVTEPDLESPSQARAYLKKLERILEYLGLYEPDSEFTIKTDANLSLENGARVEVKNITGTKAIEKALSYEASRQKRILERNGEVKQQTRGFNPSTGATEKLREKESEKDYGYIFEPDLTRQKVTEEGLEKLRNRMPELPEKKRQRYMEEGLNRETAESLVSDPETAELYEKIGPGETEASLIVKQLKKVLNFHDLSWSDSGLKAEWIADLAEMLEEDDITERNAEKALREAVEDPRPVEEIVEELDLAKDSESLGDFVDEAIGENPGAVEDFRSGDEEAVNFLVGQVMEISGGKADPREAREKIVERLEQ